MCPGGSAEPRPSRRRRGRPGFLPRRGERRRARPVVRDRTAVRAAGQVSAPHPGRAASRGPSPCAPAEAPRRWTGEVGRAGRRNLPSRSPPVLRASASRRLRGRWARSAANRAGCGTRPSRGPRRPASAMAPTTGTARPRAQELQHFLSNSFARQPCQPRPVPRCRRQGRRCRDRRHSRRKSGRSAGCRR